MSSNALLRTVRPACRQLVAESSIGAIASAKRHISLLPPKLRSCTDNATLLRRRQASLFLAVRCLHQTNLLLQAQQSDKSAPKPLTSLTEKTKQAKEVEQSQSPQKPIMDKLKELWATAKYLFKFYFNGVKQIWADRKRVAEIKERVSSGGEPLSRAEFQLIRTHSSNMRKLPLFLTILLILEEVLPLVVIWAPGLLPSTCILPSQLAKIRMKQEVARATAFESLKKAEEIKVVDGEEEVLKSLQGKTLTNVAKLYSLATWGGSAMIRRRLTKHLAYLREDDAMMRSSLESVPQNADDLARACGQRGLRATETPQKEMYESLQGWLRQTSNEDITVALLPLRLYIPRSIEEIQASLEAEKSKGLFAQTKDVVDEVIEEEKKILDRDQKTEEEVKHKQQEIEQTQEKTSRQGRKNKRRS